MRKQLANDMRAATQMKEENDAESLHYRHGMTEHARCNQRAASRSPQDASTVTAKPSPPPRSPPKPTVKPVEAQKPPKIPWSNYMRGPGKSVRLRTVAAVRHKLCRCLSHPSVTVVTGSVERAGYGGCKLLEI